MNDAKTMAITGASGMIGTALTEYVEQRGWTVIPVVRDRQRDGIYWSVENEEIDAERLEGVDAVVHLAGENIAGGRWTQSRKRAIGESRRVGTGLIAGAIASLDDPPEVLVSASGANYYGDTGDQWVDEDDPPGEGFLADVCQVWEQACDPARDVCRVVNTRFGVVLSPDGGALKKMLLPFKMGVGGRISGGDQYMSWVALADVVRAIHFAVEDDELEGPVNVTSPNPVRNAEFTDRLGDALGRPTPFPVPAPALKLALGSEMAEETLLISLRIRPRRLEEAGFEFRYPELDEAFTAML